METDTPHQADGLTILLMVKGVHIQVQVVAVKMVQVEEIGVQVVVQVTIKLGQEVQEVQAALL